MGYASNTKVPVSKSQWEIAGLLEGVGATQVATYKDTEKQTAGVFFQIEGLSVALSLDLPDPNDEAFTLTPSRKTPRTKEAAFAEYSKEVMRLWRVLLLLVKAKLEAIALGITSLRREFLADVVLPDGLTVEQWLGPRIIEQYELFGTPSVITPLALPESTR